MSVTDAAKQSVATANDRQVGGTHYKTGGEEHWDRVQRLKLDYFQGQITKYVERWKLKNGVEDLKKARHFLDKYIEINEKVYPQSLAGAPWAPVGDAVNLVKTRNYPGDSPVVGPDEGCGPNPDYVDQDAERCAFIANLDHAKQDVRRVEDPHVTDRENARRNY